MWSRSSGAVAAAVRAVASATVAAGAVEAAHRAVAAAAVVRAAAARSPAAGKYRSTAGMPAGRQCAAAWSKALFLFWLPRSDFLVSSCAMRSTA